MLPAISDFIKGVLSPDLLKALQPAGVVASSVLLLLNVLFIFPELVDRGVPFAIGLLGLGTVWQAAVATALVLLFAYLLVSLNALTLTVFTGEAWASSRVLGPLARRFQTWRRQRLMARIATMPPGPPEVRARFDRLTHYPLNDSLLMPTALGNVLNALSEDLQLRWGIDLTAAWPRMEIAIASESALASRIANERATLDFLVNLAFVLLLFAVEHLLLRFGWAQWPQAVLSVLFVLLAWLVYNAAVGKARSWVDVVGVAFDLHRGKLRTQLGMRDSVGYDTERRDWDLLSKWLLLREPSTGLLMNWVVPTPPVATARGSANVEVQFDHTLVQDVREPELGGSQRVIWQSRVDYFVLLQNSDSASATSTSSRSASVAESIYVTVVDSRIPRITAQPRVVGDDWGFDVPTVQVLPTGQPNPAHQLLWRVKNIPARGARLLRYSLPIYAFSAKCSDGLEITSERVTPASPAPEPSRNYRFTLRNASGAIVQDAQLDVSDSRLVSAAHVQWGHLLDKDNKLTMLTPDPPNGQRYCWKIGAVGAGEEVTLFYDVLG
jgi:hypothetical protein